jgi:hypothetical protein
MNLLLLIRFAFCRLLVPCSKSKVDCNTNTQLLVLHWMFCIVCRSIRKTGNSEDRKLAHVIISGIEASHRLHSLVCSSRCIKIREINEAFIGFAHNMTQATMALRT